MRLNQRFSSLLYSRKDFLKHFLACLLLFSLLYGSGNAQAPHQPSNYDANRAKLLSYLIRNSLEINHFAHKKIDDTVSEAAFGLYLKQLDYQKRILLMEDVVILRKYSRLIDDEIYSGELELPVRGSAIL
ncbi:MAG: tail-specific protease, partial [Nitrospirota bacterium]|nr:tail-specific protease [Nitrospirota bacterium]